MKLFSVVATGTREEFEITYGISASDLKFFLRLNLKTAALISTTVASILISLNQMAILKETIEKLIELDLEDDDLHQVREASDRKLDGKLGDLVPALVDEYCAETRDHDKKENQVRLRYAIDFIAPRLERGFAIEIRVGALPEPDEYDEEVDDERVDQPVIDWELADKLQDQAQKLKFIEPVGEPILVLKKPELAKFRRFGGHE